MSLLIALPSYYLPQASSEFKTSYSANIQLPPLELMLMCCRQKILQEGGPICSVERSLFIFLTSQPPPRNPKSFHPLSQESECKALPRYQTGYFLPVKPACQPLVVLPPHCQAAFTLKSFQLAPNVQRHFAINYPPSILRPAREKKSRRFWPNETEEKTTKEKKKMPVRSFKLTGNLIILLKQIIKCKRLYE